MRIKECLILVIITLVSYCMLFMWLFVPSVVHGYSMYPELTEGTCGFTVNTLIHPLRQGDLVVADSFDKEVCDTIIKRIIACEGDHVLIENNKVFINGELLQEDYLFEPMKTDDLDLVVPEGCIFVMGDNRNQSYDSRSVGAISINSVNGVFYKTSFLCHKLPLCLLVFTVFWIWQKTLVVQKHTKDREGINGC